MSTLREISKNIMNLADGGAVPRAHRYSERQVNFWIKYWRNFLIAQDVKRNNSVPVGFEQDFGCLTLTRVDKSACEQYAWGEYVWQATLPQLLDLPNNMGLTYFGLVDRGTRIKVSDYSYGSYSKYERGVPKDKLYAEKIGNIIYIHNIDEMWGMCVANARGIAADPTAVGCFNVDTDTYPIPPHLESTLVDLIMSKEINVARHSKRDNTDNEVTEATL